MKDKHTPGPWKVDGTYIYEVEQDKIIAEVETYNNDELPYEANARLMAAAPEMKEDLEEAVRLLKHLRYLYDVEMCEDEAYINDFITKAESTLAKIEGNECNHLP